VEGRKEGVYLVATLLLLLGMGQAGVVVQYAYSQQLDIPMVKEDYYTTTCGLAVRDENETDYLQASITCNPRL